LAAFPEIDNLDAGGQAAKSGFSRARRRFFNNAEKSLLLGDFFVVGARHCSAPTVDPHFAEFNNVYMPISMMR